MIRSLPRRVGVLTPFPPAIARDPGTPSVQFHAFAKSAEYFPVHSSAAFPSTMDSATERIRNWTRSSKRNAHAQLDQVGHRAALNDTSPASACHLHSRGHGLTSAIVFQNLRLFRYAWAHV